MTVASLNLTGPRKGFRSINPAVRAKYNRLPLEKLKQLSREYAYRDDISIAEREYVNQNIMLIQLARGVIS